LITAIILAAGESKRMGQPKLGLPWGGTTVLGRVIQVLKLAEVEDILVVLGGSREVGESICREQGVRTAFNDDHATTDMLVSLQTGLNDASPGARAALVALGDQPQIQEATVRIVIEAYRNQEAPLVVPSYRMRRGHPWLVSRLFWREIFEMRAPDTSRDFLSRHALDIQYVDSESATILEDLDSPEDYLKSRP
jgi:molybdenum cofactor cytidylyltransferase